MTTLRQLFHWCWNTSIFLLVLALLVFWLFEGVHKAMQGRGEPELLASQMAEEEFAEACSDLWRICQQNEIPMQFGSVEIMRLARFAKCFEWTEQDLCLGHVEEDAS